MDVFHEAKFLPSVPKPILPEFRSLQKRFNFLSRLSKFAQFNRSKTRPKIALRFRFHVRPATDSRESVGLELARTFSQVYRSNKGPLATVLASRHVWDWLTGPRLDTPSFRQPICYAQPLRNGGD